LLPTHPSDKPCTPPDVPSYSVAFHSAGRLCQCVPGPVGGNHRRAGARGIRQAG
jgi:hypothetical protein